MESSIERLNSMLIDFNEIEHGSEILTDVGVIGSGAAGITLATELDGSGHDVILLAGGAAHYEADCQELYRSRVVGLKHEGVHTGRARVHGGTTTLWAGQALPFDPIDFESREWLPHSGWPFGIQTLEPYYRRAERVLRLAPMTYDERSWPPNLAPPPRFDPDTFICRISQFSNHANFATSYRRELESSRNVRVMLNGHAVGLVTDPLGPRLDRVEVRSLAGRSATLRARYVVVCCGAIESARLMLASDTVDPRGVGNAHDLVGRYFQEHIQGRPALIHAAEPRKLRAMFDAITYQGTRYIPRFCTAEALQREQKILNACGGVTYGIPEDSAIAAAKLLVRATRRKELRAGIPRAIWNLAKRPHDVALAAANYALYRTPMVDKRGPLYLGVMSEQAPNPQSRVTLGEERDALGMRRSVLDWRLTELDRHSLSTFIETCAREFRRLGLGTVDLDSFTMPDDVSRMDELFFDCSHHMGTTRMHEDPRHGVVDADCRVHGVENLFIGSGSVFPTGGSSNPTLTIIALCLRIADRLKRELAFRPMSLAC
jgi:choline dehydrogenase-like flavoprotein